MARAAAPARPAERMFGTDGVRGIPGRYPLTQEAVRDLAFVAARALLESRSSAVNGTAPVAVMGRDTRGSGPALCRALAAGFRAAGCATLDVGVIPTPAVSYLAQSRAALCGAVVSASHNPAEFNGIKFFMGDGRKMGEDVEQRIEGELSALDEARRLRLGLRRAAPKGRGAVARAVENGARLVNDYADFLRSTFPATLDLSGIRLVVDCAHGSAWEIAPRLFEALGARVFRLGCAPNGRNINRGCGALFPEALSREVRRRKADCGISFDGDADRAVFCDERGAVLDGDALICLSALRLRRLGLLRGDKVVLTVMSNYGLLRFLDREGIAVETVPVGDRNVSDALDREGLSLGGEASGHVIFRRFLATGDGILTALQTLAALRESGRALSALGRPYRAVPQVIENIAVERKPPLESLPRLKSLARRVERRLKGEGRLFVRYSGTEPLLRIMIEGPSLAGIRRMARELAAAYLEESRQRSPR